MLELEELILWTVNPQLWGDAESPDDDVETLDGTWTPAQKVCWYIVRYLLLRKPPAGLLVATGPPGPPVQSSPIPFSSANAGFSQLKVQVISFVKDLTKNSHPTFSALYDVQSYIDASPP